MGKKILLLFMSCCLSILLWGCSKLPQMVFSTEYFTYIEYSEEVVIRGLTDVGKQKTELYIPPYLNEKAVTNIGEEKLAQLYKLESEQLKTLNLPYTIKGFTPFTSLTNLNRLVINRTEPIIFSTPISFNFYKGRIPDVYVPVGYSKIYEGAQQTNPNGYNDYVNFIEANVSLIFNYEESPNNGFYFIDFKEQGQTITKPVDPHRENYSFGGWYEEKECLNLWDFNRPIEDSKTLYALWIKK